MNNPLKRKWFLLHYLRIIAEFSEQKSTHTLIMLTILGKQHVSVENVPLFEMENELKQDKWACFVSYAVGWLSIKIVYETAKITYSRAKATLEQRKSSFKENLVLES